MCMANSYLLLGLLAVAAPWSGAYLEALLNVSYGFLALILLASLSIAVSLHPDFSEKIAEAWASEWGISVSNGPSTAASATLPVGAALEESRIRPRIRHGSEIQAVPARVVAEPLGPFSPSYIDP
jgi:hypothetical protein